MVTVTQSITESDTNNDGNFKWQISTVWQTSNESPAGGESVPVTEKDRDRIGHDD